MRIGLITQLHGAPGSDPPPPGWQDLRDLAWAAEEIGFDSFVFEDALLYRGEKGTYGVWESVAIAGAIAASTDSIHFGQSVCNAPYRSPAMLAKIAETLDEISGGRYLFGIGAGNTPDTDYEAFGFPTDRRYARFAETITIVHSLLKNGAVDYCGDFWSARSAELVLRGPRPAGPPIIIAAGGPRMLGLAARYADEWNWWTQDPRNGPTELAATVEQLEKACQEVGRDPATLRKSIDVYSMAPPGAHVDDGVVGGSASEMAEVILGYRSLGIDEVRCDLQPKTPQTLGAMAEVVRMIHDETRGRPQ